MGGFFITGIIKKHALKHYAIAVLMAVGSGQD